MSQLFFQWTAVADFMNVEKAELIDENFQLREEIRTHFSDRNIIGVSGAFRRVVDSARKVASSSATVLIHGEPAPVKAASRAPSTNTHHAPMAICHRQLWRFEESL